MPFVAVVPAEHDVVVGRDGEPAIGLDLGIELPRPPAGIAQREEAAGRPVAAADGAQDVEGRGQRELAAHHQRAGLDVIGRMEDEAAARLDRAAEMNMRAVARTLAVDFELLQQLVDGDLVDQLVDHEPHRPLLVMGAHQDHRAGKARVLHLGHGDEQLAGERGQAGPPRFRLT